MPVASNGGWGGSPALTPEQEDAAEEMYQSGETATAIGHRFGLTKNTVIGIVHRRGWRREIATTTLYTRMAALHAMMDRLLAETRGIGRMPNDAKRRTPPAA